MTDNHDHWQGGHHHESLPPHHKGYRKEDQLCSLMIWSMLNTICKPIGKWEKPRYKAIYVCMYLCARYNSQGSCMFFSCLLLEWLCSIFCFSVANIPFLVTWWCLLTKTVTECFCGPCSCIYYFALQSSHWAYKVQSWMLSSAAAEQQNSKSDKKSIML